MGLLDHFGTDAMRNPPKVRRPKSSVPKTTNVSSYFKSPSHLIGLILLPFTVLSTIGVLGNLAALPAGNVSGGTFVGSLVGLIASWSVLYTLLRKQPTAKSQTFLSLRVRSSLALVVGGGSVAILAVMFVLALIIPAFVDQSNLYDAWHTTDVDESGLNDIGERALKEEALSVGLPEFDAMFIRGMGEKLPPFDAPLTDEEKKSTCLKIAEQHYLSTTTPEQRDYFCADYASTTPERFAAFQQYLIDVMDAASAQERYDFCIENRQSFFGDRTLEYAELACETIRDDWTTVRQGMLEQMAK